jgi:CrcB protein
MDPDVDLHVPQERAELRPSPWPVLAAISAGGVLGGLARYGLSTAWPHDPAGFPWATWTINVSGSFLLGVLMVLITRRWPDRRLIRPFFGVGILGGYTTFSTSVVDVHEAVAHGAPAVGLAALAATLVGAVAAVWAGTTLTTAVLRSPATRRDSAEARSAATGAAGRDTAGGR